MRDFEKWMGLPKFKVKVIHAIDGSRAIQLIYGRLHTETEIVNTCFSYPESPEDLALALECACNSLIKSFHIPVLENKNAIQVESSSA
jgi:hypothetical protein